MTCFRVYGYSTWEFGDDLSVLRSKSMEYRPRTTVADATLRKQVAAVGCDDWFVWRVIVPTCTTPRGPR